MNKFQVPLIYVFGCLAIGIWTSDHQEDIRFWFFLLFFSSLGLLFYFFFFKSNLFNLLFFLSLIAAGFGLHELNEPLNRKVHISNGGEYNALSVRIDKIEQSKSGKLKAYVSIESGYLDGKDFICTGKAIFYIKDHIKLIRNAKYEVPNRLTQISEYKNPGTFNYQKYLANKNIYHQGFYTSEDFKFKAAPAFISSIINQMSQGVKFKFSEHITKNENVAIMNSLFLGEKNMLSQETKDIFLKNGLAHILAISGMHVGLILLLLKWFFSLIHHRLLRISFILLGVWVFIILSGLQISAIRAGFMLSVFMLGKFLNRNTNSINSIFFAAIVMIIFQPKLLFDVGFQLSFLAMLSILLFYDKVQVLYTPKSSFVKNIWKLLSLNFSVQILVLPLSIYYFHQLPTYSIIASLISVPFLTLIMWLGLTGLVFSFYLPCCKMLFNALEVIINVYKNVLSFMASLPASLLEDINIENWQLVAWILSATLFVCFWYSRNTIRKYAFVCFVPLIFLSNGSDLSEHFQSKLIIYDHPKKLIIDIIDSKSHSRLLDHNFEETDHFYVSKINNKKKKIIHSDLSGNKNAFEANEWLINKGNLIEISNSKNCFCIITNESLFTNLNQCSTIIIPRNIQSEGRKKWKTGLNNYPIKIFDLKEKGAFNQNFYKL